MTHSTWFTDDDQHWFNEGRHFHLHNKLGAHPKGDAVQFSVWAPNAKSVHVIGDFNNWSENENHRLHTVGSSGVWTAEIPNVPVGATYKYRIHSAVNHHVVDKADPMAKFAEVSPKTASRVWDMNYQWKDDQWMKKRAKKNALNAPMSVYECHLGSWRRNPAEGDRMLTYKELAEQLPQYLADCGYTHVELLPVMEHPFYGSWGYQSTGYFAPTSRYGTPQEFMELVDALHSHDIGVIIDWVPSHFPDDEHGLSYFDGTHLYEHSDRRQGFHPDWKSLIFNYGRNEVRSFLISSAIYWLEKFHIDGIRVDAVASMLYLDYSRKEGEWIPNEFGGRENLEAISFLKQFNEAVYENFPDVQTIAEESTAWPGVSKPTYTGGLGFGMKWDMGWMNDTLRYFQYDPIYRKYHQGELTFRMVYAFNENFVLSVSHDEVVHGKGSLLNKMPGDDWQRFANLRLFFTYMYTQPGKKLTFMGGEFGQNAEWKHEASLDWHLLEQDNHKGILNVVKDLNSLLKSTKALHSVDFSQKGFEWVDASDVENSVFSFLRKCPETGEVVLVVMNMTPLPHHNYRIGVPAEGYWEEIFNSDASEYGGSGIGNLGGVESDDHPCHGQEHSVSLSICPLGGQIFRLKKQPVKKSESKTVVEKATDVVKKIASPLMGQKDSSPDKGVAESKSAKPKKKAAAKAKTPKKVAPTKATATKKASKKVAKKTTKKLGKK